MPPEVEVKPPVDPVVPPVEKKPPVEPPVEKKPEPKTDAEKLALKETEDLKAELESFKKKATDLETAKSQLEEAERQKNLTLEQKLTEQKAHSDKLEHQQLIREVRDELDMSDALFSHVITSAKDRDAIKGELQGFMTLLDSFIEKKKVAPIVTPGAKAPKGAQDTIKPKLSMVERFFPD